MNKNFKRLGGFGYFSYLCGVNLWDGDFDPCPPKPCFVNSLTNLVQMYAIFSKRENFALKF